MRLPDLYGSPIDLAVFRIVVAALFLSLPFVYDAPALARIHADEVLWGFVPVDPLAAEIARVGVVAGALLGMLGIVPRLAFGVLAVAATYLLHKWLAAGGPWWDPTELLYWKWVQSPAFEPLLRVDRVPWLLRLSGIAVVGFELGFGLAVWSTRLRPCVIRV